MSELLRRKMTLRCYISRKQAAVLENNREWHRLLYNAALQERIDAWQKCRKVHYLQRTTKYSSATQEGYAGVGVVRLSSLARNPATC
jgi:hypothetical protein